MAPASGYTVADGVFHDELRNRVVPYRLFTPASPGGTCPVVIVSHGIGGSRDSMPYLGRRLAQSGYVAVHLQHPGSDSSVWQHLTSLPEIYRALREAMWDGGAAQARFGDVPFALRELDRLNAEGSLAGRLNLDRIGMAGHSYGGVSTMVAAGQRMGPGGQWSYKEPRIRAGVVMSPNLPIQGGNVVELYRDIEIPLFHITGTQDGNAVPGNKEFDPIQRTLPYQTLTIPDQYLLVLDGAGHNAFSGLAYGPHAHGPEMLTRYTGAVEEAAVLFFDAYLKKDEPALGALRGAFRERLEPADRLEWK
jgi:predicted dienelactone hydrolase